MNNNVFKSWLLPTAVKRSHFDKSHVHLSTMNFGELFPVSIDYHIPDDHVRMRVNANALVAPLKVPTYGVATFYMRSFFVPARLLFDDFNDFVTGRDKNDAGKYLYLPTFRQRILNEYFISILDTASETTADYTYVTSSYTAYYKHNSTSKRVLKILQSLGYNIDLSVGTDASHSTDVYDEDYTNSALPLLAFCKVWCDFYKYSSYIASPIDNLLASIKNGSKSVFTIQDFFNIFGTLSLYWENDFFTSAWQEQNEVKTGLNTTNVEPMPTGTYGAGNMFTNEKQNGQVLVPSGGNITLNEVGLRALTGLANWVTRNNYAGSRAVERILARFGVRVPDFRISRSEYISSTQLELNVGTVTNTAQSQGNPLGDFGGRATINGQDLSFDYSVKEYGFVIVIGSLLPKSLYYQGSTPLATMVKREDFYVPEYDKLGNAPIPNQYLFSDWHAPRNKSRDIGLSTRGIFGYHNRYTHLKVGFDRITGDFRTLLDAFHFGRDVSSLAHTKSNGTVLAQSSDFMNATNSQYSNDSGFNRIFAVTDNTVDHFYFTMFIDEQVESNMLSLNDSVPLDDSNGKTQVDVNGSHF